MDIQVQLLFVVSVLNILFSYAIIRSGKDILKIIFSLVVLFVGIWSLNIAFFILTSSANLALLFSSIYYIAAAAIPFLFFLFTNFFHKNKKVKFLTFLLYSIPFLALVVAFLLDSHFLLRTINFVGENGKEVILNKIHYFYYVAYFFLYVFFSYLNLFKIRSSLVNPIEKKQLNLIVIGTSMSYCLGIIFNLILPFLDNYQLIWIGPSFTVVMVVAISYAILKYNLFNIKVIAAELLTFTIWGILLFDLFNKTTTSEYIESGVVLTFVVIAGIFLIKSVKREVAQREEIEQLAGRVKSVNRIMSHDIKNVLGKNKDMFGMLLDGTFGAISESARGFLERVHDDTKKLIRSVIVILESGQDLVLKPVPFDLKEAVLEVVRDTESDAKANGLALVTDINEKENYTIVADRTQLVTHVLRNLVENAIHYTLAGSITVGLSKKDANTVLLSVKDTGIGIADEDKPNIFKEGGHGKDSIKVNVHSTGYGLYSVKRIVDAHDGKVWFETEEGKGTTFWVELLVGEELTNYK